MTSGLAHLVEGLQSTNHTQGADMFAADRFKRTVQIPVRITSKSVELLYGGPLPPLREDTVGTLIVPAFAFLDDEWLQQFKAELTGPILLKNATLLIEVAPSREGDKLIHKKLHVGNPTYAGGRLPFGSIYYAEITLLEPLELVLRGSKRAVLNQCQCTIPALGNKIAESVNHAYSLISRYYEPHRRSHAGNVFRKAFFLGKDRVGPTWLPLEALRSSREAAIEKRIISLAAARANASDP